MCDGACGPWTHVSPRSRNDAVRNHVVRAVARTRGGSRTDLDARESDWPGVPRPWRPVCLRLELPTIHPRSFSVERSRQLMWPFGRGINYARPSNGCGAMSYTRASPKYTPIASASKKSSLTRLIGWYDGCELASDSRKTRSRENRMRRDESVCHVIVRIAHDHRALPLSLSSDEGQVRRSARK